MTEDLKSLTLVKRWDHHTTSGGYDRLSREVSETSIITRKKDKTVLPEDFTRKVWQRLMPSSHYVNFYRFPDMLTELKAWLKVLGNDIQVVHSLYAEDQLNLLLKYRNLLKAALVGSFHLPVESAFVQRVIKADEYKRLKALDAAIVVSRSMIPDYEKWVGKGNVFYVPHGIDTHVFTPGSILKKETEKLDVLIVGGHGRDWNTTKKVISKVSRRTTGIEFSAVVPAKVRTKLRSIPVIKLYTDIPETELIHLYRNADVLLIPVRFATANNSLLESLACGTPVISTNTGGIPDYLDENCGWMFPVGDHDAIAELLIALETDRLPLHVKAKTARTQALEFDWRKIAENVFKVYKFAYERWKRT